MARAGKAIAALPDIAACYNVMLDEAIIATRRAPVAATTLNV
jgi:hypothetical protein